MIGDQEGQASRREAMVQDGAGALVLACLLWAGNFIVARSMRGVIDPETLNFLRWLLACGVFLPFTIRRLRRHGATLWAYRGWLLALGLSGLVGFQQATYTALTMTPVANAVLLLATTPILIVLSSAMLGRGGLSWRQGGAVLLSLCGVAILLGDGNPMAVLRLDLGAGDPWLLAAVSCWTAYTQLLRVAPRDLPGDVSLMASMLVALPVLGLIAALWGDTAVADIPLQAWAGVGYVGLGAALMAFLAWGHGVARKGPDVAGLYINLIPVFAIALAWGLLGEAITRGQMLGAGFVVAALILGAAKRP